MADSEISVKVVADLSDIKKALEEIKKGTGTLKEVAGQDIDNVVGKLFVLKTGFDAVTQGAMAIARSLQAVTIDLAIMGEKAIQVENGFNTLADGAGIAGEKLMQAIKNAADGTIETTALIQRSSELIVATGKGAERIPEIINLSRIAARSFGKDTEEVFNGISEAVRNGTTKQLKSLGIIIDSEQAIKKFAEANGVAVNALNETGRSQAILNAILEQGKKKFGDQQVATKSLSETFATFKNAVEDLIETVGMLTSKQGGLFESVLNTWTRSINAVGTALNGVFGNETQKAQLQIEFLQAKIALLTQNLVDMEKGSINGYINRILFGNSVEKTQRDIDETKKKLDELRTAQIARGTGEQFGPAAPSENNKTTENDITNKKQLLDNERKFQSEIAAIRLQSANQHIQVAASQEELETAQQQRKTAMEEQNAAKLAEIENNKIYTAQQRDQMLVEQKLIFEDQMRMIEMQREQEQQAMLQRQLEAQSNFFGQAGAYAEMNANRTAQAWRQAGGLGGTAMASFSNRAINAFDQIGRGSKSVSEIMKGAFFGMLGDVASAQGKTMFLTNLAPPLGPNPAGIAAGLGLVALGGLLSSMGGGSTLGGGGMGGGAGGGGMGGDFGGPGVNDAQQKRKEVTINIEGNYYDSEQSKLAIVEAVRSASDANDFTIQRGNRG